MTRVLNDTELKRLHRTWRRESEAPLALLLDRVNGPFNVGSILRTAAAFRVEAVFACGSEISWTDAKVQKTAMGTHRFLDLASFETSAEAVAEIKQRGYRLVGVELATEAKPLWEVDLTTPTCLVVGHEDKGVSSETLNACDDVAFIPLMGKVGSLNVATAASMAVYEARRQDLARKTR